MAEEHHVTLPDLRRGASIRIVTDTDRSQKGGYQLVGDFVRKEIEEPAGTVLAHQDTDKTWRLGVILPTGGLAWGHWTNSVIKVRKAAEEALKDPTAFYQEILDVRTARVAELEKDVADAEKRHADTKERMEAMSPEDLENNRWIKRDVEKYAWQIKDYQEKLEKARKRMKNLLEALDSPSAEPDRDALWDEREKLTARLEEIDAALGV